MFCEATTKRMQKCSRRATRPVEDDIGFCSWRCTQHGRGRKTYKLFRPWRKGNTK